MAFSMLRTKSRLSMLGYVQRNIKASKAVTSVISKQPLMKLSRNYHVQSTRSLAEQAGGLAFHKLAYMVEEANEEEDFEPINDRRVRGDCEFWRRKMRTLHGVLDIDKNGVLSFVDFSMLADNIEEFGHLSKQDANEFRQVLRETWEKTWGEVSPYNLVTLEQYLTDMEHVVNDPELRKKCHAFLPYLFKAIDMSHSGYISLDEFKLFFRCLGLTDEDAAISFAIIDDDNDGKLSLTEFVRMGRDFFLCEDEHCVSRMFWGPLADK